MFFAPFCGLTMLFGISKEEFSLLKLSNPKPLVIPMSIPYFTYLGVLDIFLLGPHFNKSMNLKLSV